jgi:hypothetical protein
VVVPAAFAATTLLMSFPAQVLGQGTAPVHVGRITFAGSDAVEVSGRRGTFTEESSVTSAGRSVSRGSLHPGMLAELEVDPEGRVLELRVTGVVE